MGLRTFDGPREVLLLMIGLTQRLKFMYVGMDRKTLGGPQDLVMAGAAKSLLQSLLWGGRLHMCTSICLTSFVFILHLIRHVLSASMDA